MQREVAAAATALKRDIARVKAPLTGVSAHPHLDAAPRSPCCPTLPRPSRRAGGAERDARLRTVRAAASSRRGGAENVSGGDRPALRAWAQGRLRPRSFRSRRHRHRRRNGRGNRRSAGGGVSRQRRGRGLPLWDGRGLRRAHGRLRRRAQARRGVRGMARGQTGRARGRLAQRRRRRLPLCRRRSGRGAGAGAGFAERRLDFRASPRHSPARFTQRRRAYVDQAVFAALFHLVERRESEYLRLHLATRRTRRSRRIRQQLLPNARRPDRSGAGLRATLGHLQWRRRGVDDAAGMERLAAPYLRRSPERGDLRAREWEVPHRGNLTGTPAAVRPKGSTLRRGQRQATGGDYQAWTPT